LLDSILEGDELNLVLSTTATEGSDAGSYPITLSFSNENYTLRYTSANFTVLPKPITVQLLDQSVEWTVAGIEISQTAYQILEDGYEDVQIDGIVITTLKSSYKLGESYVLYGSYQGVNYDIRFYTGTLSLFEVEEAETEPSEETPEEDTKNGIDETPDDQETGKEQEETVDYAPQTEQTIEVTELLGGCMSRFESSVAVLPFMLLVLFALKKKDRK
jgi:hypothetical protein